MTMGNDVLQFIASCSEPDYKTTTTFNYMVHSPNPNENDSVILDYSYARPIRLHKIVNLSDVDQFPLLIGLFLITTRYPTNSTRYAKINTGLNGTLLL